MLRRPSPLHRVVDELLVVAAHGAICCPRRGASVSPNMPLDAAMHRPGEATDEVSGDAEVLGKETWGQFASKIRHGRRRVRVVDVTAKMSYEYQMLKRLCRKRPNMRQWTLRDEFCNMSPGVVVMSPSMQAAFMKVFRLKDKGSIRQCLRDIVPIIEFRNREEKQLPLNPDDMIPEGQPDTLNQKKRELFERKVVGDNKQPMYLNDHQSQARLRRRIRQRLIKFQRQLAVSNAIASRTVMYSQEDAIGYFLFRGPAMYAALHRVFFEVSKLMPHFVPKSMLDFGTGSGTAILVAKEVYDPSSLAYPLYRSMRQSMSANAAAQPAQLEELRFDLKRLERNNAEKKKARFMAVAALIERGEVDLAAIPVDLRSEIVEVARRAAEAKRERIRRDSHARNRDLVDGNEWSDADPLGEAKATTEDPNDTVHGEDGLGREEAEDAAATKKSWWERFVDGENAAAEEKTARKLKPLQEVVAIEPSPGMMEIGVTVLHDDVPNVSWKRYLMPEDETIQHDLVVAAYTLSEIADDEQRTRIIKQLWSMTRGVLVLVEFANLTNFDMMMKARDIILQEKDVGLWDWQPTIVAPCPHEKQCPIRFSKFGIKRKKSRLCNVEVNYRSTFVEVWARHMPLKISIEPVSYMVFARNELVPHRAEARKAALEKEEREKVLAREKKQRELYEASLSLKDVVFERLSEEALHRPNTTVPPPLPRLFDDGAISPATTAAGIGRDVDGKVPLTPDGEVDAVVGGAMKAAGVTTVVKTSNQTFHLMRYPQSYAAPLHKFNRAYVDAGFQRTRPITPQEMLTVRSEAQETTRRFWQAYPTYYRIVSDPSCRGKITADFCTPDGDLIRGRVYRRFYGDQQNAAPVHQTMRWQYMGGWRLMKRSKKGGLFPTDVPLYTVTKVPQIDFPNTLVDRKMSLVQKTAMQVNDPMSVLDIPDADLTVEDLKLKRSVSFNEEQRRRAESDLESLFGSKVLSNSAGGAPPAVDARTEISPEMWHEAVRKAKQRVVKHSSRAIPNAAKLRQQTRKFRDRARFEQRMNRQRKH